MITRLPACAYEIFKDDSGASPGNCAEAVNNFQEKCLPAETIYEKNSYWFGVTEKGETKEVL
jgi:hypothetical protein